MAGGGYHQRTPQNLPDSGDTVLIYFGELTGGARLARLALRFCLSKDKPFLLLNAAEMTTDRAAQRIRQFVARHAIRCLNVAGPKENGVAGAHAYSYAAIRAVPAADGTSQTTATGE